MMLEPYAICTSYGQLIDGLRRRRQELGLSQMETDARAGLQEGYTGKLEVWDRDNGRRLGPVSMGALAGALGVAVVLAVVRHGKPRTQRSHPDQMAMDLTGGDMRRHDDAEFVRRPGRKRRASE